MLQFNVAWYQLISFHPTSCVAVCWRLDDPDPFPQGHPFHRGERGITVYLYPESILLSLRYLIWSSFQYLILTYILEGLVTYFSTHACLAWNQFSSSYLTSYSYIAVGWRLDDPFHRGRGDDGLWPWPWQGGWGGDPEPGTYIFQNVKTGLFPTNWSLLQLNTFFVVGWLCRPCIACIRYPEKVRMVDWLVATEGATGGSKRIDKKHEVCLFNGKTNHFCCDLSLQLEICNF